MPFRKSAVLILFCLCSYASIAQQTHVFTEAQRHYKQGNDLFDKGIFAPAQSEFQKAYNLLQPINEEQAQLLFTKAKLNYAKCAVRLNQPDGEKLVLDFTRQVDPDPVALEAIVEMGDFYYDAKKYEKAISLYDQIDPSDLSKAKRNDIQFRLGYSYFIRRKFSDARVTFEKIRDIENKYYYPSNYYYGMTMFFENRYDEAVESFNRIKTSKKYREHIPYYIGQIYFAQGEYNKLISYAQPLASKPNIRKKTEMHQLLGQAYFEMGEYNEALHYLQYYADNASQMREEDYYQLGYTLYQRGEHEKAISSLEKLNKANSKLGQHAMYILADAQLKRNDRIAAKNAFFNASKLDFDKEIQEESLFNYAKLCYELKLDREATSALKKFPQNSKYHIEAQSILSAIFLNTKDYENTIKTIEAMPNKTPKMKETLQQVVYNRGVQLLKDGNIKAAKELLRKSLDNPINNRTKALTLFWQGDIAHNAGDYNLSIKKINKFLALSKTSSNLPDEASVHTANYIQGYNYLKQKDYVSAFNYFESTIQGIEKNQNYITDDKVKHNILGDAILRAGDCSFKRNKYNDAVKFYESAIGYRFDGTDHALFQKAIIQGLQENVTDKLITLDELVSNYPNSSYTDDALLQLGITYQAINKNDQAVKALNKLTSEYRGRSELVNRGYIQLGLINFNQGALNTSITNYKSIFSNNPEPKEADEALIALEEIYVEYLGKPNEYLAFRESIPGFKVDTAAKDDLNFKAAESQYESAKYSQAIQPLSDYIKKFPNGRHLIKAYFYRADCFVATENYTSALADYENVIRKGSSNYYEKALKKAATIAYNQNQDFAKALTLYTKLQEAASSEDIKIEAQLGAIRSAYRSGKMEAVYRLTNDINSNSNSPEDDKVEANYYAGKMAYDTKNYDPAVEYFNKVVRVTDDERAAEGMYVISHIYYLKRELDFAKTLAEKSAKESRAYPYWVAKSLILLSDVLTEQNNLFYARAALEGLLDNFSEDPELVRIAKAKLAKLDEKEKVNNIITPMGENDDLEMEVIPDEGGGE